jgi:hypothetical protein
VGGTAFDHLVAEFDARHDKRDEIATAKQSAPKAKTIINSNSGSLISLLLLRQYPKL